MGHPPDESAVPKLFGRASIAAAGTAYQQGVSLISGLIVARVIGASDYGIFSLARSLVDVTGILTRLGLDIGLQRYFGEAHGGRDQASRIAVLRQLRVIAGIVALLPVAAVALGLGRVLEANVYSHSQFGELLLCLSLALPFMTDIAVLGGAYKGRLKLHPSVLAECILMPTLRLAVILLLFVAGWRLWAVAVGTTLGSFLASAFLAVRARSDFPEGPQRQAWTEALQVLRYSTILAVAVLVTTLTASVDLLTLGRYASTEELGQYSLVKMLLTLMGVFGGAFGVGLGALIAERHVRGDLAGARRVIAVSARWIALATMPIFAVFLLWGAQIALFFGPSFAVPQDVVSLLATGMLVLAIFGPCGWALSMTGRHVLELKILLVGLVIASVLCWVAVPALGQLGAAIATCASLTIANLARALIVRRVLHAFPIGTDVLFIAVASVGLAWASESSVKQLPLCPVCSALAGVGCFVLAYTSIAWMHLLNESEKKAISGAIRNAGRLLLGAVR